MSFAELRQKIAARKLPPLLLLHGEESFFIDEAVRLITEAVVAPDSRDFNLSRFHGRELKAAALIEQARTYPVFASHRLVIIKNVDEVPAEQLEGLIEYVEDPVPETVLLVTGEKIDGRRKFFQAFRKQGEVYEFRRIYENQLPTQVKELAAARRLLLTGGALKLFCKRVGTNLAEVHGELEKLAMYVAPRDLVEEADVAAVVSDRRTESVFALTDALGAGQSDEALRLLGRLLEDGQAPLMILAMVVRHFRQLWKARCLVAQNAPQKDLPRLVGVSPYFLKNLLTQSERYDDAAYRRAFELFLETDLALKSSGSEPEAHMERLLLQIAVLSR